MFTGVHGAPGVEGAVIVGKLLEKTEEEAMGGRLGYNAATGEFEDLVKAGVIDPLKACIAGGLALRARVLQGWLQPSRVCPSACLLAVFFLGESHLCLM